MTSEGELLVASGDFSYGSLRTEDSLSLRRSFRKKAMMGIHVGNERPSLIGRSMRNVVNKSFSFGGSHCSVRDVGGTATIPNEVFNLVKNLVGAGVLALPSGVAAFASAPSAILPATVYTLLMGAAFGYFFLLLGKTCKLVMAATYREVWEDTMGDTGASVIAIVNMLKPAMGNLAYSMILADTFKSLFETAGFHVTRTESLLLITLVVLLPLCLLKNLKVLSPFSLVGILGMLFTAIAMGIRYWDGSYAPKSGKFVNDLPEKLQPEFGDVGVGASFDGKVLIFLCMLYEAFVAHYNAPRFYIELKDNTVERFGSVVNYSFLISSVIYVLITAFGFLTFGANCDGYILNNYSTNDSIATFCRLAIAIAIVTTYPLAFIGFRDGIMDVLEVPIMKQTTANINMLTVILLCMITVLAVFVTDLGLINAVGGGTLATAVVFIFPALMFRAAVFDELNDSSPADLKEAKIVLVLMWIGIVLGIIGVCLALMGVE